MENNPGIIGFICSNISSYGNMSSGNDISPGNHIPESVQPLVPINGFIHYIYPEGFDRYYEKQVYIMGEKSKTFIEDYKLPIRENKRRRMY